MLADFHSRLLLTLHGIPEPDLRRPERQGAWSIFEVICHLADHELLTLLRVRMILAGEGADLPPLQQREWVESGHRGESVASVLETFWFTRRSILALVERLTPADLARRGNHPNHGPSSIADLISRAERHQEKHLGQIERIKTTLGLIASQRPDTSGVVASTAAGAAVRSPGEGITIHDLWREGVKRSLLVEMKPGAQWPGLDYHVPGPEAVYVVSGDFDDGANVYRAGTFLHHPAGSSHSPRTNEGCVLFVYYPEG